MASFTKSIFADKLLVGLIAILVIITMINAFFASLDMLNNSDNVIYAYLFSDSPHLGQMILPGKHPNIFKFPLYLLQSVLPYGPKAIIAVNIFTGLVTIVGCGIVTCYVFGRDHWRKVMLAFSILSLVSPQLHSLIVYTTVRNFEFVVSFLFMASFIKFLINKKIGRAGIVLLGLTSALLSFVISGDDYFIYVILVPSLVTTGVVLLRKGISAKKALYASVVLLCILLLGKMIHAILPMTRLFMNDPNYLSDVNFIQPTDLLPSAFIGFKQFLEISGMTFSTSNVTIILLNIFIGLWVSCGLYGFIVSGKELLRVKKHTLVSLFTSLSAVIFITTFAAYILSGLVLQPGAYGDNSVLANQRYIAIMPLLLLPGIIYASTTSVPKKYKRQFITVIVLTVICAVPVVSSFDINSYHHARELRASFRDTANKLKQKDIPVALTGYWYGSEVRLWSNNSVDFAVVAECNKPSLTNSRVDWYKPSTNIHRSALVIDTSGPDIPYLGYCTEEDLLRIYGKPAFVMQARGATKTAKPINIWVYNYDVRTKLQPVKL